MGALLAAVRHFYLEIRSVLDVAGYTISSVSRGSLNGICLAERERALSARAVRNPSCSRHLENKWKTGEKDEAFLRAWMADLEQGVEHRSREPGTAFFDGRWGRPPFRGAACKWGLHK